MRTLFLPGLILIVTMAVASADSRTEVEQAEKEYEQAAAKDGEAARSAYVEKLAGMMEKLVSQYRQSGARHDEEMTALQAEMKKHPAPRNSDSKKLSQLLVGHWESPRREYTFRKNGRWGSTDGPMNSKWRIQGNQYNDGERNQTIILLNNDYFIFMDGDAVFFHSRVK